MGKAREITLRVRLSIAEYTKLERYAEAHGIDKSKVIRKYVQRLPWKSGVTGDNEQC